MQERTEIANEMCFTNDRYSKARNRKNSHHRASSPLKLDWLIHHIIPLDLTKDQIIMKGAPK